MLDGAQQLQLNGSACFIVKQQWIQALTQSPRDGCKSAKTLNVFVLLKQPSIGKHTNLNTFVLLLRQWLTEVTQTSQEEHNKSFDFQIFCIVKKLFSKFNNLWPKKSCSPLLIPRPAIAKYKHGQKNICFHEVKMSKQVNNNIFIA